jgi:hypothetical protein
MVKHSSISCNAVEIRRQSIQGPKSCIREWMNVSLARVSCGQVCSWALSLSRLDRLLNRVGSNWKANSYFRVGDCSGSEGRKLRCSNGRRNEGEESWEQKRFGITEIPNVTAELND